MDQLTRNALLVATGTATEAQMATLGAEAVVSAKSGPQLRVKMEDPMPLEGERPIVRFVASDETPDRMGDIIRVAGWQLENYLKNSVILWGHQGHKLPIGKGVPSIGTKQNGERALFIDVEFAVNESEKAAEVYALVKGGFLNAVSVGFIAHRIAEVSDEERAALGLGRWGVLIEEAELLEVSVCSIPANPNALAASVKCLRDAGLDKGAEALEKSTPSTERELFAVLERMSETAKIDGEIEEPESAGIVSAFERIAKSQADTAESLAAIVAAQKDHLTSSRQLVDALADLTSKLHVGGERSGPVPEVAPPVADPTSEEAATKAATAKALEAIAQSLKALK